MASNSKLGPCATCPKSLNCCINLDGLKVSQQEWDSCFAAEADKLTFEHEGPLKVLYAKGQPCPNFSQGCTVYAKRPMECRLYPHSIGRIFERKRSVTVSIHFRTSCPSKHELKAQDKEAIAMVRDWASEIWPAKRVTILNEENVLHYIRVRCESAMRRIRA